MTTYSLSEIRNGTGFAKHQRFIAVPPVADISARVLSLVDAGADPVDALRAVCGTELVNQMISDVYDTLRRRTA